MAPAFVAMSSPLHAVNSTTGCDRLVGTLHARPLLSSSRCLAQRSRLSKKAASSQEQSRRRQPASCKLLSGHQLHSRQSSSRKATQRVSAVADRADAVAANNREGSTTTRFSFHVDGGGVVTARVEPVRNSYVVTITADSISLKAESKLHLYWGYFQSDRNEWSTPPRGTLPPNSLVEQSGAVRTPFEVTGNLFINEGREQHTLQIKLPKQDAPYTLTFVLLQPAVTKKGKEVWYRRLAGGNFCISVGMRPGSPSPLGASAVRNGVNFALYSRHAEAVKLCLFDEGAEPMMELDLDPSIHRTGDVWHVALDGLDTSKLQYGYRVEGDLSWENGNRYHAANIMLDPYARRLAPPVVDPAGKKKPRIFGLLDVDEPDFDWEDDFRPRVPMHKMVVYEMDVKAFTGHPSSNISKPHRGGYLGLIEKIDHLAAIGVNAVLLLPLVEVAEDGGKFPADYSGFSRPVSFFAPLSKLASDSTSATAARELKTMIKELHKRGIEVLLDVVYDHTAEGTDDQPWPVSMRGIDNATYYLTDDDGKVIDFNGCNALNVNNPVTQQLVIDSLTHWVTEYRVDGFCFARAPSLLRGQGGIELVHPPLIEAIAHDTVLGGVKLIAELIDQQGNYLEAVTFPHWGKWGERNFSFCGDIRRFIRGDSMMLSGFATRVCGSGDKFVRGRRPSSSVNFVTSRDGLSLTDLVSYGACHIDGRDGKHMEDALSWNCGVEGPTVDANIAALRNRQVRNFVMALFLSQGVPVLSMGSEYGHSTGGVDAIRSNPTLNYFRWDLLDVEKGARAGPALCRFTTALIKFRKKRASLLQRLTFISPEELVWHGRVPNQPHWDDPESRLIAFTLLAEDKTLAKEGAGDLYIAFNAHEYTVTLDLPTPPMGMVWHRLADTNLSPPEDFSSKGTPLVPFTAPDGSRVSEYMIAPYTSILLEARMDAAAVKRPPSRSARRSTTPSLSPSPTPPA
eukprot:jgi/Chlat1/3280/Chrsp22S03527